MGALPEEVLISVLPCICLTRAARAADGEAVHAAELRWGVLAAFGKPASRLPQLLYRRLSDARLR